MNLSFINIKGRFNFININNLFVFFTPNYSMLFKNFNFIQESLKLFSKEFLFIGKVKIVNILNTNIFLFGANQGIKLYISKFECSSFNLLEINNFTDL